MTKNVNNANGGNGRNGGNGGNNGCTYKGFMACNPKEYDGKGGAIALTRWIKKMENIIDSSRCSENQKVKYVASSFVNKALTWWNTQVQTRGREAAINRFHKLAKLVLHLVTPESSRIKRYIAGLAPEIRGMLRATQPTTIQSAILRAGILTDEVVSCGTLTKGNEKRKGVKETTHMGSVDAYMITDLAAMGVFARFPSLRNGIHDEYEHLLKEEQLEVQFSGEEANGSHLDMHVLHNEYINNKLGKQIDYAFFLKEFPLLQHIQLKIKSTTRYKEYLSNLLAYLVSFIERAHSLQDVERLFLKCYQLKLSVHVSVAQIVYDARFLNSIVVVAHNHYIEPTELEIQEMVNILVSGEAYDKVFNHLGMLHAPLEGKVLILTTAKSLLLLLV
ncbi:reverse transcriptase domain-containing protein [Tanacetum coccineum]